MPGHQTGMYLREEHTQETPGTRATDPSRVLCVPAPPRPAAGRERKQGGLMEWGRTLEMSGKPGAALEKLQKHAQSPFQDTL